MIGSCNGEADGTLIVITAAMHGNEKAGVEGLLRFFKYLEQETTHSDFRYKPRIKGKILGLLGNTKAYREGKRYIEKDMNRCWLPSEVSRIKNAPFAMLENEDLEVRELLDILSPEISGIKRMFLLDLHTTSSDGGIFCIAGQSADDIHLAKAMEVPLVLGLLDGLQGTTLQYFQKSQTGADTTAIAFEAGHHDDPASIERCFEACCRFLYVSGCLQKYEFNTSLLQGSAFIHHRIPKVLKVVYRHPVDNNAAWCMNPGYKNFQKVDAGERLATYEGKEITSPIDGYLLMPLYQGQGKDGFFIAEELPYYEKTQKSIIPSEN